MDIDDEPILKKPLLKKQDTIYIDKNNNVCIHKKKELKLDNGNVIVEYYIEETKMNINEYAKYIINNES